MKLERKNILQRTTYVVLLSLLTCLLWGSAFPAIKVGFALFHIEGTGSKILFAGYRFLSAGVIALILVSIMNKKNVTVRLNSLPYIFLQGLIQTTAQYVCFYIGLSYTTGAKGAIINGSNGFFSILFAHFLLKQEKMTIKTILGCIVGFIGVIIINFNQGSLLSGWTFMGEGMVLLCSMAYGLSAVTLKMFAKKETPNAIAAYQLLFGGMVLTILGLALGGEVVGFTVKSTLLFAYLAIVPAVTFCVWGNLLKYNPVGKITIFGFSISLFGVILSAMFLGEKVLDVFTISSLLLVSLGIIIVSKEPGKSSK